jgi:transcription initiation factor TFIID TATA-box-binding protein
MIMVDEEVLDELEYKIENVVATAQFEKANDRIDLNQIARRDAEVEYNPERFPGVIMRATKPRATYLVFSTGKMVITGLRDASEVEAAVKHAQKRIRKAKIDVSNPQYRIENVVASGDLHTPVDLNMAALVLEYAMYEPEVFPGLIYRVFDPKCCFLIFSTGKVVCTGAKDREDVRTAFIRLRQEVRDKGLERTQEEIDEEELAFI